MWKGEIKCTKKNLVLRLVNSCELELNSGFICNWGGGIISPTKNAKYFAKNGSAALGRGIGKSRIRPDHPCSNASMPWQRETPKPSRPLPPKVRMSSFHYLCILFSQMKAFVASPRKPPPQPPNPHVNSRTGGDRRRNHSASSP